MVVMKLIDKVEDKLNRDVSIRALVKTVLILLVILLFLETGSFWKWIFHTVWNILCPFVLGFVIAYILRAPISLGEKYHIKRGIMIAICYVCITLFAIWLISSIVPMILSRTGDFINSMINGVNWLTQKYAEFSNNSTDNEWLISIVQEATKSLKNISSLIPQVGNTIPQLLTNAIGTTTTGMFAIIISIFMSIEWEKIRNEILRIARRISKMCFECTLEMNEEVSSYIRSLLILMIIKFVEYSLVYLLIGHEDWLILALMTSISLLIPYIGPTIVNCIAILTALSLPVGRVVILIILIVVLSQVDEYVIAPLVHSHNTSVTPMWALFSIFTFSTLFGIVGLIVAIPAFLSLRVIYLQYRKLDGAEDKV